VLLPPMPAGKPISTRPFGRTPRASARAIFSMPTGGGRGSSNTRLRVDSGAASRASGIFGGGRRVPARVERVPTLRIGTHRARSSAGRVRDIVPLVGTLLEGFVGLRTWSGRRGKGNM